MAYNPQIRFFFRKNTIGLYTKTSLGVSFYRYGEEMIIRGEENGANQEFTSTCLAETNANILQNK